MPNQRRRRQQRRQTSKAHVASMRYSDSSSDSDL